MSDEIKIECKCIDWRSKNDISAALISTSEELKEIGEKYKDENVLKDSRELRELADKIRNIPDCD